MLTNKYTQMMFLDGDAGDGGGGAGGASGDGGGQGGGAATATSPWVADEAGTLAEGWLDRLPDAEFGEYKPTLQNFRTLPDILKTLGHQQKQIGKPKGVTIPGEGAKPEEIAAFRKALGIPEKPEDYGLKPEKLPDGIEWDEEMEKSIAALALEHNVPPKAMKALVGKMLDRDVARNAAVSKQVEQMLADGEAKLKQTWGGDFDKKLAHAGRVAKTVGLDPASPGLTDPNVVIALERLGAMMSEDRLVPDGGNGATNQPGKVRAKDIMTNPDNPDYKKYWAGDQSTVSLVRGLLQNG